MDSFISQFFASLLEGDRVMTMGGWAMFFWSEWRRDSQGSRHADQLAEVSKAGSAAHLATATTLEGLRETMRLGLGRSQK